MSQYVINIGAIPNDGTGDPLRTAFNDVNLNFDQVFAAGPVLSNIQITNNSILTLNTNGNLVLNPNGIGVVQANAHVVPDQTRVRNLGSTDLRWNTTYTQYLNTTYATIGTANIGNIGTLTIDVANLHILGGSNGYVLQTDGTGNLTWTAQTGGSGNGTPAGANTQIQYNNAGNFGATAGFTFNNASNVLAVPGDINLADGTVIQSSGGIQYPNNGDEWDLHRADGKVYIGSVSDMAYIDTYDANISVRLRTNGENENDWIFDPSGNLTLPDLVSPSINYANGVSILDGVAGNYGDSNVVTLLADFGSNVINTTGNITAGNFTTTGASGNITGANVISATTFAIAGSSTELGQIEGANTVGFYTSDNALQYLFEGPNNVTWGFNVGTGGTGFPTLNVQRGDNPSGTIQGQTLLFGDNTKEAIITTPDGNVSYPNSQRLVINPGAGAPGTSGEGGDIYLWAGRGGDNNGSGGDVKIRGGQGMADGTGGYIRMEAGDSQANGQPGWIEITGGQGGTTSGGYVQITGGVGGSGTGGAVDIIGGFGQAGPGAAVSITGGGSANGLAEYGNVNIGSGASTWTFDATGNLTTPANGIIKPVSDDLTLDASGGNVYVKSKGHTFLFDANGVGRFVMPNNGKIAADSNLSINVGDWANSAGNLWTFDNTGNLTVPGSIYGPADSFFNIAVTDSGPGAILQLGDWDIAGFPKSLVQVSDNVHIVTGVTTGGGDWNFDTNGDVTVPGDILAQEGNDLAIQVFNPTAEGGVTYVVQNRQVDLDYDRTTQFEVAPANIILSTDFSGNRYQWFFDNTGNVVLPDTVNPSINYANGQPYGGSSIPVEPTANGYFSTLPDFLQFVGGTLIRTGQTSEGVFFDSNAGDGDISYPVRTNFSIGGTTPVVVTVDVVVNDECSDFGLCVFEGTGIQPQWAWDPNSTRIAAQYDCTTPAILTLDDSSYSGYNIPAPGTYRVRFTYDPTNAPNIILETLDTSNVVLDTLTMGGTLNTSNDYYIGFSADQDNTSLRTYIQNLTIAVGGGSTYTDSLQLSGSGANTGNVTFSNQTVIGTGDQYGGGGLYLAPGTESTGNLQYLRVRGGDYPTHIHFDTGNNQYFDQYFGDDYKYVKLANTGNIVINTSDYGSNTAQWTFGTDGEFYLPTGGRIGATKGGTMLDGGAGNSVSLTSFYGNGYYAGCFTANPDGNVSITTYTGTGVAGSWQFDNTGNLTTSGNIITSGPTGNITGANVVSANTFTSPGNVVINSDDNTWTFGTDGNLNLPGGHASLGISNSGYLTTLGNDSTSVAIDGDNGVVTLATNGGGTTYTFVDNFNATSSANVLSLTTRNGDSNPVNSRPQIVFGYNGTTDYPQFIHTIHNAGTPVNNRIEFWTSDGTQAGTFPANAVLGLTVTNGNISTGGILTDNYYYANGVPVSFSGSNYGNANVANFLANFGSNVLSTTGNVVSGNISANTVNVAGNVTVSGWVDGAITSFTGAIAGNVLTVTGAVDGAIARGQTLYGNTVAGNTVITLQLTQSSGNAGGNGTYRLNQSQTVTAETMSVNSLYMDGDLKLAADHGIYVRDSHDPYEYDNLIGISEVDATVLIGSINTNGVTLDNNKEYKVDSALNPGTYMAVAKVDAADQVILSSGNSANTLIRVGGDSATTGYGMKLVNGGEALIPVGLRIGDNTNSSIFAAPLEVGSILGAAANNQSSPAGIGLPTYRGTGNVIANDEWGSYLYGARYRGTINSPLPVKNNDWLMEFGATAFDGTNNGGGGEMAFRVDGTVTSTSNPSRWELYVCPPNVSTTTGQTLGLKVDSALAVTAYGNINTSGNISATGNITGNYILGNGSQLTGIQTTSTEPNFTIQTGNFSATVGSRYGVNTVSNTVTATLPASPATGGAVFFADAGGAYSSNNLIIDPNGLTIMGATGNMTVSTNNQSFGLFYNGTTWRTYNAG